jgi:hypothetical protein
VTHPNRHGLRWQSEAPTPPLYAAKKPRSEDLTTSLIADGSQPPVIPKRRCRFALPAHSMTPRVIFRANKRPKESYIFAPIFLPKSPPRLYRIGGGLTGGIICTPLPTGIKMPAAPVGCFVRACDPALMADALAKVLIAISTYFSR